MAVLACLLPAASASAAQAPTILGALADSVNLSGTTSVAVSGSYAYTTAYHSGVLAAVNISNPKTPTLAGESAPFLDTNLIGGSNVAIAGGYAFVVSKNRNASTTANDDGNGNSLTILDIHTNPAQPAIVGTIRDTGKLFGSYGIAVSGNYAFVAYQGLLSGQPNKPDTSTGGFSVIDITSPGSPKIVANIDNGSLPAPWTGSNAFDHATTVAISGNYAFVNAFYAARLTVINIANPTSPSIVAVLHDGTNLVNSADYAIQGNYLYAANQTSGSAPQFTVVNIANPLSPQVVAELSNGSVLGGAYRIRVLGDFAYVSASSDSAVAAVDISNPTAPRLASWAQSSADLTRTTGLDIASGGQYVVASSPYQSGQSNATYPPYPQQTGGAPNTGTISVIKLDPSPISVTITPSSEPANPTTSTSASFTFATNDAVAAVQCGLDGAPLGPCTSATTQQYPTLSTGQHTFTVQATDAAGNVTSAGYTWVIGAAPVNTAVPQVSGSPIAGQTLTATTGTWSGYPAPSYAYQWSDCDQNGQNCNAIHGAGSSSYVVQSTDAGERSRSR